MVTADMEQKAGEIRKFLEIDHLGSALSPGSKVLIQLGCLFITKDPHP